VFDLRLIFSLYCFFECNLPGGPPKELGLYPPAKKGKKIE
jgi:hypothetical protein